MLGCFLASRGLSTVIFPGAVRKIATFLLGSFEFARNEFISTLTDYFPINLCYTTSGHFDE